MPTDGLSVGSIVMVPLKNKIVTGIIWSKSFNKKSLYLKKEIQKVLPFPPLSEKIRNFSSILIILGLCLI